MEDLDYNVLMEIWPKLDKYINNYHNHDCYSLIDDYLYKNNKPYPIKNIIRNINKIKRLIHPITYLTYEKTRKNYENGILKETPNGHIDKIYLTNDKIYSNFVCTSSDTLLLSILEYENKKIVIKKASGGILNIEHHPKHLYVHWYTKKKTVFQSFGSYMQLSKIDKSIKLYKDCKDYDAQKKAGLDLFLYHRLGKDMGNNILHYVSSIKFHDLEFGGGPKIVKKNNSFLRYLILLFQIFGLLLGILVKWIIYNYTE